MIRHVYALVIPLILLSGCSEVPGDAAYRSGHKDIAAKYYEDQFNLGSVKAGDRLAQMYSRGDGVPQDYAKAFLIYSELAARGEPLAFHNLGVCYQNGLGTKKDLLKAEQSYRKAADSGVLWAIFNLGTMYSDHLTQKDDDIEGLTLLLRAQRLAKGDSGAEVGIREDRFGTNGGHVAKMRKRMTPQQIALAEEAAKR